MRLTTDGTDITDPNFTAKSTKHTELGDPQIETRSAPALLGATHRAFTFYLADPISSIAQISADSDFLNQEKRKSGNGAEGVPAFLIKFSVSSAQSGPRESADNNLLRPPCSLR